MKEQDRPFQFSMVDALVFITIVAGVTGLWRYEAEVNPAPIGQSGYLLHAMRLTWNAAFVTNVCLVCWVRWRACGSDEARRQWRRLSVLSLPQTTFFALILVGMGIGAADALEPLRIWFSILWLAATVASLLLLYGLTVEAVSPPHRFLHLSALFSGVVAVVAPCCF